MNQLLCLFLSTSLLLCSCSDNTEQQIEDSSATSGTIASEIKQCNCEDLIHDNGYNWYYLEDHKSPFSGKCTLIYPDGSPKMERDFVEGKVHGLVTEWYENGQLKQTIEFDTNLQSGEKKEWDETGRLIYHANYKRGELDTIYLQALKIVTG